jgi:putative protease
VLHTPDSVELLAPAGTWEAMEAAVDAGADAVYLGGKRFNMRLHRSDVNFDYEQLAEAREYTHTHGVKLYITVNNLLSEQELPAMRTYLAFLDALRPDALIIQDLAVLQLAKEMAMTVPLHASVMMNIHNEAAVRTLQKWGITRVVFNRELSLDQLALIRERTGIEVEYFIHGDMCVAHSGQCLHSGLLFGQSSNRGRCLKPCRWPYRFTAGGDWPFADPGPYKLAMKDMCLYRHLPQLITAGVCSFKIEGRMRTPDFVGRVVGYYRQAIDAYFADPTGYTVDEEAWQNLYETRARDFTTCYAFGNPGGGAIGYGGEREPRFFSQAVKEAGLHTPTAMPPVSVGGKQTKEVRPQLAVRVADLTALAAACQNGADIAYIGGEAFKPALPWSQARIGEAVDLARQYKTALIVTTPRITGERECRELERLFADLADLGVDGVMVSNLGSLRLARQLSRLPVQADFSFSLMNSTAASWLRSQGVVKATASLEAPAIVAAAVAASGVLPVEVIVHGPLEAMVMDYCLPKALAGDQSPAGLCQDICAAGGFALTDSAGQSHRLLTDQYCRSHILLASDLCLLEHLPPLYAGGISHYRIEGQHYRPELVGQLTAAYRCQLDRLVDQAVEESESPVANDIAANSPRPLGIGVFRYRLAR